MNITFDHVFKQHGKYAGLGGDSMHFLISRIHLIGEGPRCTVICKCGETWEETAIQVESA